MDLHVRRASGVVRSNIECDSFTAYGGRNRKRRRRQTDSISASLHGNGALNRAVFAQTALGKPGDDSDRAFVDVKPLADELRRKSDRLGILDLFRLDTFELDGGRDQEVERCRVRIDVEFVVHLDRDKHLVFVRDRYCGGGGANVISGDGNMDSISRIRLWRSVCGGRAGTG
jgi:hypothetical protein